MNKKALEMYKAELEKLKAKYEKKLNTEIEKHNIIQILSQLMKPMDMEL